MVKQREPVAGWEFTEHISRCCFARVMVREAFDRKRTYRCSCCDLEAQGHSEAAICCCGIKLKTGVDAGIRCEQNPDKSPEFPASITATQTAPPTKNSLIS
jgi:hypothetical protein